MKDLVDTYEYWRKQIQLCRDLSKEAHADQTRWNGNPYFTHPERIAKVFSRQLTTDSVHSASLGLRACISYLHDVLEDCEGWTVELLSERGVDASVIWGVQILTKLPKEKYLPYILRLKATSHEAAIDVKIADVKDNLSDLHTYKNSKMKIDRYELALHILEQC